MGGRLAQCLRRAQLRLVVLAYSWYADFRETVVARSEVGVSIQPERESSALSLLLD